MHFFAENAEMHCELKKTRHLLMSMSLQNIDGLSKFLHC